MSTIVQVDTKIYPQIVLIAASLGGIAALQKVLSGLPPSFPIPIVVVQHRSAVKPDPLTRVLSHKTQLRVENVVPNETLKAGTVYIAPPDRHVIITGSHRLALSDGRRIKHVLSSADPLFESAAQNFGQSVIAVILTGNDSDAAKGALAVKDAGGMVLAQDRATSRSFQMPQAAIALGAVDQILPLDQIAPALIRLAASGEQWQPSA